MHYLPDTVVQNATGYNALYESILLKLKNFHYRMASSTTPHSIRNGRSSIDVPLVYCIKFLDFRKLLSIAVRIVYDHMGINLGEEDPAAGDSSFVLS